MERTAGHRLGAEETEAVLKRAAELDREHAGSAMPALRKAVAEPQLDETDLERIAAESGLSPQAVRRALDELHGGKLERAPEPGTLKKLVAGEATEASVYLDEPPDAAQRRLDRLLHSKGLEPVERRQHATLWEPSPGLKHTLSRTVNWDGSGVWTGSAVESSVYAAPGGASKATLRGDAGNLLASVATIAGLVLAVPAGIALLIVLAMGARYGFGAHHLLATLIVVAFWAALTTLATRGFSKRRVRKLRRALERTLRELTGGETPRALH